MKLLQYIGSALLLIAILIFTAILFIPSYKLTEESLAGKNDYHKEAIKLAAEQSGILNKEFSSGPAFISELNTVLKSAQKIQEPLPIPDGVAEWDFKLGNWEIKNYVYDSVKASGQGLLHDNKTLFFWLTFGLAILGGLIYSIPLFKATPGIKHNGIYHNPLTKGVKLKGRKILIYGTILSSLIFGYFKMNRDIFWPLLTLVATIAIVYLVFFKLKDKELNPPRSTQPIGFAWMGIILGTYLIAFYVLLYWFPEYLTPWIELVDPVSRSLSGNPASNWFLYGFMYTIIVAVMGIRMIAKYQHNKYQIIRTLSVMFFQTSFAFIIPEILVKLNQPFYDFKNFWPLNYTFFFDYNLKELMSSGNMGMFMLFWGIIMIIIGIPLITYFFGKRWYCSWVCGCGGLAETFGDPWRQLSDKSLRAWRFERYIIHGVLVFAVFMTIMVLYSFFTESKSILFLNSDSIRAWYGFLIGSAFAGVVGTGFYPLMGNRMWCRFGCPLAAYLGLVQKFKSRFRITTNGGQCISCGNCSTYCEMGIDVRWYAQRGQDIVRSSCVGCGVCSAVCPRGVLKLENSSEDISTRTTEIRTIHVSESEVKMLS